MATNFEFSADVAATLDQHWQCLCDRDFWVQRLGVVGSPDDTIGDFRLAGDSVEVELQQVVAEHHIPSAAKKIVGGNMAIDRFVRYTRSDTAINGQSHGGGVGGLLKVKGTLHAVENNAVVTEDASGRATVPVPLIGKNLEKFVVNYLRDAQAKELGFVATYLGA